MARSFLARLNFNIGNEPYRCTREDLIRLGRAHDPNIGSDDLALIEGTNQFKVTVPDLNEALKESEWAQNNILIAVAAASSDGTSGLKKDASLSALRTEIEPHGRRDLLRESSRSGVLAWTADQAHH